MNDLVSCIITTYHRASVYVERAIKSIQNQSYSAIEIIVIDDNQNGNKFSIEIQEAMKKYPEIRYIKQDGNQGACAARNLGILKSKGKYIAFLDDDDEWMPNKIQMQMEVFNNEKNSNVGLVFCDGYVVYEDSSERGIYSPGKENREPSHRDMLYADYIGSTSQPLLLKEAVVKAGLFDVAFPARQDYDMWIRVTYNYKARGLDIPLFYHYQNVGEQITASSQKALEGYIKIYQKYIDEYRSDRKLYSSIMNRILLAAEKTDRVLWYKYRIKYKLYRLLHKNK